MESPIFDRIRSDITANDIVLYMKGTPAFPQCGFSAVATQILSMCNVRFISIDVMPDPNLRQALRDFADWPTLPQLYIKGEFIGSTDIIKEMYQAGELQSLLQARGLIATAEAA